MKVVYVDVDGTLTGPGGDLLHDGTVRIAQALLAARAAGLAVVPVSGRGRVQLVELCRLLGFGRGIGELGCLHLEGRRVTYDLGRYPDSDGAPVAAMYERGGVEALAGLDLVPHDPWNEGREATMLFRGPAERGRDHTAVAGVLAERGLDWCQLVDNGPLTRDPALHVFHLAPAGTGKAPGVRADRHRHNIDVADATFVGNSAADLDCAPEVGRLWLVANAERSLDWPHRTEAPYGAGVAEVIEDLVAGPAGP